MDLLQGYGHEESPPRPPQDDNCMGVEKRRGDDVGQDIVPLSDISDDGSSPERVKAFVASFPSFFRNNKETSSSPNCETARARGSDTVDPKVAMTVEKWIQMKNKGYTITQDLRRRNWYKSPDMMMSMLKKFDIDDCGTFLDDSAGARPTRADIKKAWDRYEEFRKIDKETQRPRRNIEFTRGDAVSAAVAAAQAHAASFKR